MYPVGGILLNTIGTPHADQGVRPTHGVFRYYNGRMRGPLIPTPLDQLGRRAFSFYPAIVGIEHNEWALRRITWSEVGVVNRKTSQELWIPRRFVGEVSATEEPYVIVGLVKELEHKAGTVLPHIRRVIEMPRVVNGASSVAAPLFVPATLAPVISIRPEVGAQSRTGRRVLAWIAAGILACLAAALALILVGGHRRGLRDLRTPRAQEEPVPVRNLRSF